MKTCSYSSWTSSFQNRAPSRRHKLAEWKLSVSQNKEKLTFSPKNTEATACKACCGQAVNQSMMQLFTRPGKFRQRVLRVSPTGDMASTMWRLLAHLLTKYCQIDSRAGGTPALFASSRTCEEEDTSLTTTLYRIINTVSQLITGK